MINTCGDAVGVVLPSGNLNVVSLFLSVGCWDANDAISYLVSIALLLWTALWVVVSSEDGLLSLPLVVLK